MRNARWGTYLKGHLPVFQHAPEDLAAFRLFNSQLVGNGAVSQPEIARAFSRAAENGEKRCRHCWQWRLLAQDLQHLP
jgi:hypothetical protein